MSERLERLYLAAVTSGWWLDWQRYYAAEEAERRARAAVLNGPPTVSDENADRMLGAALDGEPL